MITEIQIKKKQVPDIEEALEIVGEIVKKNKLKAVSVKITPLMDWGRSRNLGEEDMIRVYNYDLEISGEQDG